MRIKQILLVVVALVVALLALVSVFTVWAGNTDSTSAPTDSASQMYTLENIYDRLTSQGNATKMSTFTEPGSGPGSTMYTLDEIYDLSWPSRVAKTGQTTSYATGDDGDLGKGVSWPSTRFITSTTGIVTDTLTGLIWLEDANCIDTEYPSFDQDSTVGDGKVTWQHALDFTAGITVTGTYSNCAAGFSDWRLPNVRELYSLINLGQFNSATWLNMQGFSGVESFYYWSSTTCAPLTDNAWYVYLDNGSVDDVAKTSDQSVWPVRGGQ